MIRWTVALQAPLSKGFSRPEYWSGLPFLPPRDLPDPGIQPKSLMSPALAGGFFTAEPPGKPPLEWVAILFSRDLPNPRIKLTSPAWPADSLPLNPQYKYVLLFKLTPSYFLDFYEIDFKV